MATQAPSPVAGTDGVAALPSRKPRRRLRPHLPQVPRRALAAMVVILSLLVWWGYETWLAAAPVGALIASGTVEADDVIVAPEVAGRLVDLPAEEGRTVRAGDVLARLDDGLVQLQLQQADPAMRRQLELQAEKYTLRAPVSGVVTRVPSKLGEVVSPGQTIATVADLSQLTLTVYVLERDLGRVQVGQRANVSADPYPARTFVGTVTSISTRAEFTPRNVQTQRDRQNLVFGVKLRVANPDNALKPGLPVDVTFQP